MKITSRDGHPLVRILVSETDEWLADVIAELVHDMAKLGRQGVRVRPCIRAESRNGVASKNIQHFQTQWLTFAKTR